MNQFKKSDKIVQSMQFSESDQQELLTSLLYTLSVAASEDGISTEELLQKDFHTIIKRGQDILDQKRKSVKILWDEICLLTPRIQNFYYIDTIKNIGSFLNFMKSIMQHMKFRAV